MRVAMDMYVSARVCALVVVLAAGAAPAVAQTSSGSCANLAPITVTIKVNGQGHIIDTPSASGHGNSSDPVLQEAVRAATEQARSAEPYPASIFDERIMRLKFPGPPCAPAPTPSFAKPSARSTASRDDQHPSLRVPALSISSAEPDAQKPAGAPSLVPHPTPPIISRHTAVSSGSPPPGAVANTAPAQPLKPAGAHRPRGFKEAMFGAAPLKDYQGPDAGQVIVSFAGQGIVGQPYICLRSLEGGYGYDLGGLGISAGWIKNLDVTKAEFFDEGPRLPVNDHLAYAPYRVHYADRARYGGRVLIRDLKPGRYEVYRVGNEGINCDPGRLVEAWQNPSLTTLLSGSRSVTDFSAPFEIKPGRATYIGAFRMLAVIGKTAFLGRDIPAGARFMLTDEAGRDLLLAKRRRPSLGEVDISVANADALGSSILATTP